ncbi:MAG: electron transfer flavoprotein beta subunit [Gammaproteobacteria bacterium]|jgi:electron transfer flavoprotein beta subunit
MKILIPVKRTIDANVRVRINQDSTGVEIKNIKMGINPFCEIAVEEALRLRESGKVEEVIVVTVGPKTSEEVLRHGLAMGADRAILIETEELLQPLGIAKILKVVVERESPDLIILGKQSIDDDNNQTGQMLAALLGWPQGTFASRIELSSDKAIVTREVDDGLETVALNLPAVVTTDLRLNQPRYLSLPNIMKSKKMPLDHFAAADFDGDFKPRLMQLGLSEPAKRSGCIKVQSIEELVDKLHNEARVI